MKGCLSLIFKTIIGILVFFGLLHLGVIDFIKDKISEYNKPSQEKLIEKTKDLIDLSQISDEYSVEKNFKILKNRMIIAEHNASGQKMIIIEPKGDAIITKSDITNGDLEEKVNSLLQQKKYKIVKFDKLEFVKNDSMNGMEQEIPYVKIYAEVSNLPFKTLEGIVGVAENQDNKNLIIISANEKGKYSQIITEAFYSKVK